MPAITLELSNVHQEKLRFGARVKGVSESQIVAQLIDSLSAPDADAESAPTEPVAVFARYEGKLVEGRYDPTTETLVIDSDPWNGERFRSASGAAKAVVRKYNPTVESANRSGFVFWQIAKTGEKLGSLRA